MSCAGHQIIHDRFNAHCGSSMSTLNRAPEALPLRSSVRLAIGASRSTRAAMAACSADRHAHLASVSEAEVRTSAAAENAALGQFAHDFLGEERIAGGPPRRSSGSAPPFEGLRAEQLGDQSPGFRIAQRRKGNSLGTCHSGQCALVFGPVRDQHQRRRLQHDRKEIGQPSDSTDLVYRAGVLDDERPPGTGRPGETAFTNMVSRRRRASGSIFGSSASGSAMPSRSS